LTQQLLTNACNFSRYKFNPGCRVRVNGMYFVLRACAPHHAWLSYCISLVFDPRIDEFVNTLSCPFGISYVFMNSTIILLSHSHSMPMSQLCISVNFELDHDRSRSSFVTYMNDLIVILTEASLQSNTFSDNRQRSQTSSFHRFPSIFTQSSLFTYYIKTNDKFI